MMAFLNTAVLAHDRWGDDGPWPWFPIIPLLFITLWVVVILTLRRRWQHCGARSGEQVLAERYARGEIDEDEYRARRSVLRRKE